MKKLNIMMLLLLGMFFIVSCDSDRDSNPTLQQPTTFVLNTPAYATSNVYDLENSQSIELTCSQPDYGYTAAVTYAVQVSLVNDFETEGAYDVLPSTYFTAKMDVNASELAVVATELSGQQEENFPIITKIYIRLKAALGNGAGVTYSNSIELAKVRLHYALDPVVPPTNMYINGSFVDWDWAKAVEMVPTHSNPGTFWGIVYIPEGAEFKLNSSKSWDGQPIGVNATLNDNAGAGLSGEDNIKVSNGGWYQLTVYTTITGRELTYTVNFDAPNIYSTGDPAGGFDTFDETRLFTVPADADGEFVSPAFVADGEMRMCIKLADIDWWKTEFIILDGKIEYRGTGDDQTRVNVKAGQKAYLKFSDGTGHVE